MPARGHHDRKRVRFGGARQHLFGDRRVVITPTLLVFALHRVGSAECDQSVGDPEVLEHLKGTRLNALTARAVERRFATLNQTEGNTASSQVNGERKPISRPRCQRCIEP